MTSSTENINSDGILKPQTIKGNLETDDELRIVREGDLEVEKARRASTNRNEVNYLYCLVFPAQEAKAGGMMPSYFQKSRTPLEEMENLRHEVCQKIEEAGFKTESVFSAVQDMVIVKVGCNDDRLLKEAELIEYKLGVNEKSLKHILELDIKAIEQGRQVEKPVRPIYLDYLNYDEEKFELIQHQGGEESLPVFRLRENRVGMTDRPINLYTAQDTMKRQCKQPPFKDIHFKYDTEWEEQIVREHSVQLYKTFLDGTILKTTDRIFLIQSALEREESLRNGYRGAGLDLDKLRFDKSIKGHYPIQYSSQIRKAKDLTADEIYDKFKSEVSFLPFRIFLPFKQPVQDMRDYCGEKIAYYFAFLEFYSLWLAVGSIFGFFIFIVQLAIMSRDVGDFDVVTAPSRPVLLSFADNQDAFANFEEPQFDEIEQLVRDQGFTSVRTPFAIAEDDDAVLVLQNPTELPYVIALYAFFVCFWGTFFLEYWKRRQATLAFKWGTSDFESTAQIRPEFKSDFFVPDEVTGLPTPYRDRRKFFTWLVFSAGLMVFFVGVTVAAFAATYVFKAFMAQSDLDPTAATQTALVLNALTIQFLGGGFKKLGKKLTDLENHRTDIEHEDQLILKIFILSFFNSYTTLLYFAFFKSGTSLIDQNQYCVSELEDFEQDGEQAVLNGVFFSPDSLFTIDSCYGALGYSLVIIFGTQIFVSNFMEVGIPYAKGLYKSFTKKKLLRKKAGQVASGVQNAFKGEEKLPDGDLSDKTPLKSPAETQLNLNPYESPFYDYLELALQFGYVTLFVAAFPLAPFLALLNNFVEVWVDASKICVLSRRPKVARAQDIGSWVRIFEVLSFISIVTNSAVLVFTSDELVPLGVKADPQNRVWTYIAFILSIFAVKYIAGLVIKDVPIDIETMQKRQKFYESKIFFDAEDDSEKLFVAKGGKKKEKDEDQVQKELDLHQRFEPLQTDPYVEELVAEVRAKMKACNVKPHAIFGAIDVNDSDFINLKELKKALLRTDIGIGENVEETVVAIFVQALDIDGDGSVSREELNKFLSDGDATDVEAPPPKSAVESVAETAPKAAAEPVPEPKVEPKADVDGEDGDGV